MRTSAAVDVVIPVRNRPIAVRRAIASVLAQTWQNFELFVVDDGSTDDTATAVAGIGDPRVTLIRHDRTRGASAARNTGIRAGSAAYVAFLDSDDEWLPTKLERQLAAFERCAVRPALVYVGREILLADGSVERRIPRRYDDLTRRLLTANVVGGCSNVMLTRQALHRVGPFDEMLPASQDVDLWLRVAEAFSVDFVPDVLVRISQRAETDRITANVDAAICARELFCRKHRARMLRHGVLHRYLRATGWLHHRRARDARMARRLYLQALAARPIAPLTFALLVSSWLPISCVASGLSVTSRLRTSRRHLHQTVWSNEPRPHGRSGRPLEPPGPEVTF